MSSYATPADLQASGISAAALAGFTDAQKQAALDTASGTADDYLRARVQLPLSGPPTAGLVRAVCAIAAFDLLGSRGFNPEMGTDSIVVKRYDDAISWLKMVADGRITPLLSGDTSATATPRAPLVVSGCPRGW